MSKIENNSTKVIVLRDLKFIKTFTINEFKECFGLKRIDIKRHPKGFLYFPFRHVIGICVINSLPKEPLISIVVDKYGVLHYLLHEADDIQDSYKISIKNNIYIDTDDNIPPHSFINSEKTTDYKTKIIVPQSNYDIKNDNRFLLPFIKGTKIGFVNKNANIVIPALYQFVLDDFYNEKSLVRVGETYGVAFERKTSTPAIYLRERYGLLKSNGEFLFPIEYEDIKMPIFSNRIVLHSFGKGYAVIDLNGSFIVPFGKYNYIDGYDTGLARVKLGKNTNGKKEFENMWGIIDENGTEVLQPIYTNIWNFYNKSLEYTRVESDEKIFEFHFSKRQLMPNGYQRAKEDEIKRNTDNYRTLQNYRESTYNEYNGSYAQDIINYSDQDIDDAFDGDPDAYWNID